jgi:putative ABC transport system permease protein
MTMFRTSLRNLLAHKGRVALSAIAVLLSVAFVCGTLVLTDTMTTTFDKLFATTASDVTVSPKGALSGGDVQTTAHTPTLPPGTLARLRALPGVTAAYGNVDTESVTVADDHDDNVGAVGGGPTLATAWNPSQLLAVSLTSGHLPKGPGQVVVDADTAHKHHLKLGQDLRVIALPGDFHTTVTGIVTFKTTNPGAAIFYFDTATAQRRLIGQPGAYTSVGLTAAKGVTDTALKHTVAADLGSGYKIQTAKENADENEQSVSGFLRVIKDGMLGFAGIAVLVGIFLIVNTFSMLVAQRTREIGLMRAIGAGRGQINRSILAEALLLGLTGSILGIGGGIGLAIGMMKLMSGVGLNIDLSALTVKATTPVVGLLLGVLVTVFAAFMPAFRAGRTSPMAALRDNGLPAEGRSGRVRAVIGLLVTGVGVLALVASANADKAGSGAKLLVPGVLFTLVGLVVIAPLLSRLLLPLLGAPVLRGFGSVGRLAQRNALRNPRRTGATAGALMIGLALVAALSVVGSSMVASATHQLDKSVGADYIIQPTQGQMISPQVESAVKHTPGLAHVTDYKEIDTHITVPGGRRVAQGISAADPSYAEDLQTKTVAGKLLDAYGPGAMSVGQAFAEKYHVRLGDHLTVAFKHGRTTTLKVTAITSKDTTLDNGAMYTNITTAARYLPADRMPLDAMMFGVAKPGKQAAAYSALKTRLHRYPQIQVRDQADYKKELKKQIGQLLNLIYGLLGLAIIVAVLGVVNTLALSVVERTREIGLMRAIGLSRRQLRRMIRLEAVVIALFGAVLGLGLGMAWGITAQHLLATDGLNVLRIPWSTIVTVFIGSAFVGLAAALVPAFRAGRMNVLGAIATD